MAAEVLGRVSSSRIAPILDGDSTSGATKTEGELMYAIDVPMDDEGHEESSDTIVIGSRDKERPNPQDSWLPITESTNGSAFTATFHLLCSGIGTQALILPAAFVSLGWFWGTLCLTLIFAWQFYTIWLLVHLHDSSPGTRYSRYLHLSVAAFGEKLGKLLSIFPTMYLSGGTCVMLIITGGGSLKLFSKLVSQEHNATALTGAEWYLVFICLAILVAQFFPNLNSLAWMTLLGSITAVTYCTLMWTLSVSKGRPEGVSYDPSKTATSDVVRVRDVLNAIGIIALAFRGHNLVLEIQGTMPTNQKHSSIKPMWRGVNVSYLIIATCFFPLAIAGYWVYGNQMPSTGGMLSAFSKFNNQNNTSRSFLASVYLIIVINCLCTFQIYAMPVFDNLERVYITKKSEPCPKWLRRAIRVFFGGLTYLIAVAFPFLGSLGAFIGSISLPLTLVYPCFMWISIKKPQPKSAMWCFNLVLGILGSILCILLVAAALWSLVANSLEANFFKPR